MYFKALHCKRMSSQRHVKQDDGLECTQKKLEQTEESFKYDVVEIILSHPLVTLAPPKINPVFYLLLLFFHKIQQKTQLYYKYYIHIVFVFIPTMCF